MKQIMIVLGLIILDLAITEVMFEITGRLL